MLFCLFLQRGLCIRPLEENITEHMYTCLEMTEKGPGKISKKVLAAIDCGAGVLRLQMGEDLLWVKSISLLLFVCLFCLYLLPECRFIDNYKSN